MYYVTTHLRSIAHQESRALRLLLRAHGRYPTTKPLRLSDHFLVCESTGIPSSYSTVYAHRSNEEESCENCKLWRRYMMLPVERKYRLGKSGRAESEKGNVRVGTQE